MKHWKLVFFSLMAFLVSAVFVQDANAVQLNLAIEWFDGFTGHIDAMGGMASILATVVAAGTKPEQASPEAGADGARHVINLNADDISSVVRSVMEDELRTLLAGYTPAQPESLNPDPAGTEAGKAARQMSVPSTMRHLGPEGVQDFADSYRMMRAFINKDWQRAREIQVSMIDRGSYGSAPENPVELQRSVHNTLTDADGGVFLPTRVADIVLSYATTAGVIPQLATRFDLASGEQLTVPNTASDYTAFAVVEGANIKSRKLTFAKVTLLPKKWGVIAGWTSELGELAAAQVMNTIAMKVGDAFRYAADNAGFNGDGTATYNSITGILNVAGTGTYTMPSTKTAFSDLAADDLIDAPVQVDVAARKNGVFAFHPDIESVLRKLKDGAGQYVYQYSDDGRPTVAGKPVYYTEVLPALSASAANTEFGVFGDFSKVQMGMGRDLQAKLLDQATIIDTDDSTEIHLGASDSLAIRYTQRFDLKIALASGFAVIKTAAS